MKILIICTKYPPDTSIGAVRPYMFAKYLAESGHEVTVVRSGDLYQMPDDTFKQLKNVRIISLHGDDSPANYYEKYKELPEVKVSKSKEGIIPLCLRPFFARCYRFLMAPIYLIRIKRIVRLELRLFNNIVLNKLKNEKFDVVFSTCGGPELVYEGAFAASFFKCEWIQDFRDLLSQPFLYGCVLNAYMNKVQKKAVEEATFVTGVSEGVCCELARNSTENNVYVLYNGYDSDGSEEYYNLKHMGNEECLSFCYTGRIYSFRLNAFMIFVRALKFLIENKYVEQDKIRIKYAGPDSKIVKETMTDFGLISVLEDYGFVTRREAYRLQDEADVFLVFSWNTNEEKGVLTGKFYEGIRAKKNIVSIVVGDSQRSELFLLNDRYNYGFCYEEVQRKSHESLLHEYLKSLYNEKMMTGMIKCNAEPLLATDFLYKNIAKQLEKLMMEKLE